MQENLRTSLDLILASEGGFVDDPAGGSTNMGVTLSTLGAYRGKPTSVADLKAMPQAEAEAIFNSEYAAKIDFAGLPSGLDYAVLDCAVNSGPSEAARLLQLLLSGDVVPDGIIGAKTRDALALNAQGSVEIANLIEAYCRARLSFMQSLKNWSPNAAGWTARVARVQVDATRMARGFVVTAPVVIAPTGSTVKATGAVKVTATASGKATLATLATVIATAGAGAIQASAVLQPYAAMPYVKYTLEVLTALAALSAFIVAYRRAQAGATT